MFVDDPLFEVMYRFRSVALRFIGFVIQEEMCHTQEHIVNDDWDII